MREKVVKLPKIAFFNIGNLGCLKNNLEKVIIFVVLFHQHRIYNIGVKL